jgi:cytochrome c peroxidase
MKGSVAALVLLAAASLARGETPVLAPGYSELQYTPPMPGTYQLHSLGEAVDGRVLDASGQSLGLHQVMGDRLVLMGFIYTHCPDMNGCPLASYVMKQVQERLVNDPVLRDEVVLISLSFDPQLDTPDAMMEYAHHFRRDDFDWRFLTTASEEDLQPILQGYGQYRSRYFNEDGSYSGSMSHILRVFLIDRDKRIRNIYSAGFLHADTVTNDLRTLLIEEQERS